MGKSPVPLYLYLRVDIFSVIIVIAVGKILQRIVIVCHCPALFNTMMSNL